jgi:hypothetical protein
VYLATSTFQGHQQTSSKHEVGDLPKTMCTFSGGIETSVAMEQKNSLSCLGQTVPQNKRRLRIAGKILPFSRTLLKLKVNVFKMKYPNITSTHSTELCQSGQLFSTVTSNIGSPQSI